jgi:hypothetical protein
MEIKRITRHTLPTKFDIEPFGTLCLCFGDYDAISLYAQISKTSEPEWVPFFMVFERIFDKIQEEPAFQLALFELLDNDNKENLQKLIDYLCTLLH